MSDVDWADTLADTILSTLRNGGDAGNVRQLLRTHAVPKVEADALHDVLCCMWHHQREEAIAAYDAATRGKGGGDA